MKIIRDAYGFAVTDDAENILVRIETKEVDLPDGKYEEKTVCEITNIDKFTEDKAILTAAVKLIVEAIEEEFYETPYIPGDLLEEEKAILEPLFTNGLLTKKALLEPEFEQYEHDYTLKDTKANLVTASVKQREAGNTRKGHLPKTAKIEKRLARSYKENRPQQILRHVATQLYNYCLALKLNPTEVQIMYLNSRLFIATNVVDITKTIFSNLLALKNLQDILTTPYKKRIGLETEISKRFANKLENRIFKEYESANPIVKSIKKLLNAASIKEVNVNKLNSEEIYSTESIYFVTGIKNPARHAEENLLDIFDKLFEPGLGKAIIYGKKRPCFNCHSRLETYNHELDAIDFNPYKGLFFKEDFFKQGPDMAAATAEQLAYTGTIYESSPGGSGYCTMSDSNAEESDEEYLVTTFKKKAVINPVL